ncbi:MAG TPA: hypothetical protein VGS22_19270 [Thermoanaerobaculia bacterium]|nr:hypothetical protein [Thermoanaerobaculia bacterium]
MQIPSINIVSADVLDVLSEPLKTAENSTIVKSLREARQVLDVYGARPPLPGVNVDLLGHSTRDHRLLRLGGTVIDALDPLVRRFFEEVERSQVLQAMNAVSVRLLGCETGVSPSGQRTLRMLADILGVPVFGSRKRLSKTHHTATGFNPLFATVLIEAAPSRARRPGGIPR